MVPQPLPVSRGHKTRLCLGNSQSGRMGLLEVATAVCHLQAWPHTSGALPQGLPFLGGWDVDNWHPLEVSWG